ncbi:MAG: hypothetical protein CR968_01270 [Flavobacteriia bacterium]|nr:MAG: hypothetical protein CR968_01270 [Flavobacteriia bacterium]
MSIFTKTSYTKKKELNHEQAYKKTQHHYLTIIVLGDFNSGGLWRAKPVKHHRIINHFYTVTYRCSNS